MLFQYTLTGGGSGRGGVSEYRPGVTTPKVKITNLMPKLEPAAGLSYAIKMSYKALATANPMLPASISLNGTESNKSTTFLT